MGLGDFRKHFLCGIYTFERVCKSVKFRLRKALDFFQHGQCCELISARNTASGIAFDCLPFCVQNGLDFAFEIIFATVSIGNAFTDEPFTLLALPFLRMVTISHKTTQGIVVVDNTSAGFRIMIFENFGNFLDKMCVIHDFNLQNLFLLVLVNRAHNNVPADTGFQNHQ